MALADMEKIEHLQRIEDLIKSGEQQKARDELLTLKSNQISPVDLIYFCSLFRRVGLSIEAIKVLQPLVYPKARLATAATYEEKLEYASNLVRLGILSEAERILSTIDHVKYPIVLIRQGFLSIAKWDYEKANLFFESYLNHQQADPYNTSIAKVNILQGLVNMRKTDQALALQQELLTSLDPVENKLLLAAVYEFSAEIYRLKGERKKALDFIDHAKNVLRGSKTIDEFLIRKQEQIIRADITQLKKLKLEASKRKHYESVRDLDFQIALIAKNKRLLSKVYWKTGSIAYRHRIITLAKDNHIAINLERYCFGRNKGITFDLETQSMRGSLYGIKREKAIARLFKALLVEGYKPFKIIDLFAAVYENEIFFPNSSADKMHQLIKRFRHFLKAANLPIQLICEKDHYRLLVHGNFTLTRAAQPYQSDWEFQLYHKMKSGNFTLIEAQKFWTCSRRTCFRRLKELKTRGVLKTSGKTSAVRYRFNS